MSIGGDGFGMHARRLERLADKKIHRNNKSHGKFSVRLFGERKNPVRELRKIAVNLNEVGGVEFWMNQPLYALSEWLEIIREKYKRKAVSGK